MPSSDCARLALIACVLACASACSPYPRDPEATLPRVQGGVLHAGAVHDPPFVVLGGERPHGTEVDLLQAHARALGARIVWHQQGAGALMRALEEHRLDVVAGGHVRDSPWAEHVALTRPYRARNAQGRLVERTLALAPGENAWQLSLERHLLRSSAMLEAGNP